MIKNKDLLEVFPYLPDQKFLMWNDVLGEDVALQLDGWCDYVAPILFKDKSRYYHNIYHVGHMFAGAKRCGIELSPACQTAVLLHDIVYQPNYTDEQNIELSKDYYRFVSQHLANKKFTHDEYVCTLIGATTNHFSMSQSNFQESPVIRDLDLLVFSHPDLIKIDYYIFNEYAEVYGSDDTRKGRSIFLKRVKDYCIDNPLYRTTNIRKHFESTALKNLEVLYDSYGVT